MAISIFCIDYHLATLSCLFSNSNHLLGRSCRRKSFPPPSPQPRSQPRTRPPRSPTGCGPSRSGCSSRIGREGGGFNKISLWPSFCDASVNWVFRKNVSFDIAPSFTVAFSVISCKSLKERFYENLQLPLIFTCPCSEKDDLGMSMVDTTSEFEFEFEDALNVHLNSMPLLGLALLRCS